MQKPINAIKFLVSDSKFFIFFIVGFLILEVIVNPTGNFPLNDDWAYASAVKSLVNSGEINIGSFPAMILYSHIIWGALFVKFFGFTFFILRLSTIVSAIIGFYFLNRIVIQITGDRRLGIIACVTLLLNPLFFNLVNTFMTDINFNTLLIICFYSAYNFYITRQNKYYVFFLSASIALTLLRQFGIVVPFCFFISFLFNKPIRIKEVTIGAMIFVTTLMALKLCEQYLFNNLPKGSTYKFSGNINFLSPEFINSFLKNLNLRYKEIIAHLLFYVSPIAILHYRKNQTKNYLVSSLILLTSLGIVIFINSGQRQGSASIFSNLMIGPETFSESFLGKRHNLYPGFEPWLLMAKIIFSTASLFVFLNDTYNNFKKRKENLKLPLGVFIFCFILFYSITILITESFFDRYHIPLVTFSLLLLVFTIELKEKHTMLFVLPLLFTGWIALFGTKDYLEWNRQRRKAYKFLRNEIHIPKNKIAAGFEVNCWNDGSYSGWLEFINLSNFDYVIQFNPPAKGFKLYKEYEFQRYLPYKKDKVKIFVKDTLKFK